MPIKDIANADNISTSCSPNRLAHSVHRSADAKAYLWSVGEYSIAEIVETMQRHAERDGLVDRIGQDAINSILNTAFSKYAEAV
jgi:hypothetical protein